MLLNEFWNIFAAHTHWNSGWLKTFLNTKPLAFTMASTFLWCVRTGKTQCFNRCGCLHAEYCWGQNKFTVDRTFLHMFGRTQVYIKLKTVANPQKTVCKRTCPHRWTITNARTCSCVWMYVYALHTCTHPCRQARIQALMYACLVCMHVCVCMYRGKWKIQNSERTVSSWSLL